MRLYLRLFSLIFLAMTPLVAECGLIQPDSVDAFSSEFTNGFDGRAINTINGSGLPVGFGVGDTHANYASGNHWTTNRGFNPLDASITWGFASAKSLDAIHIWNHLSTQPPAAAPGYDVTLFDLTLFDGMNNVLLSLNDVAIAPDTAIAQTFSFGGTINGVRSVQFDVEAVQNSSVFTGLAEVAFNEVTGPVIPEPSSMALMGLGVLAFGAIRRRRNR